MPSPLLPADVQRFILTSVPSVPFLEALLLFHREPSRAFTPAEVGHALYVPEAAAARLVDALEAAGLVLALPGRRRACRFEGTGDELRRVVDRVAACHARHLIAITHLIHDDTQRSATRFADAFRRQKKERPRPLEDEEDCS
jgi:hypothetical protein